MTALDTDVEQTQSIDSDDVLYEYDPDRINRPVGILTPEQRARLSDADLFDAEAGFEDNPEAFEALQERVFHALIDFQLLAVTLDANSREHIMYEGGDPTDFDPGVPSAGEASIEDIIAFLFLSVDTEETFYELVEIGLERAHHLQGTNADVTVETSKENFETAAEIATRLDREGVDAVTPRDLQILYFAGVITDSEYKSLFKEKYHFL